MTRPGSTLPATLRIALALLIAGLGAMALPMAPGRAWSTALVVGAAVVAVASRRRSPGDSGVLAPRPGLASSRRPADQRAATTIPFLSPAAPRAPPLSA